MAALKVFLPAAALLAGFLVCASNSYGTADYAKKEKKSCAFCHDKMVPDKAAMNQNLNAVGNCYKDNNHTLAKCEVPKK
jgi:hypothetical protein